MQLRYVRDLIGKRTHSLPPDSTVHEAACLMSEHRIGAVLVMSDQQLLGIFTERDLLDRVVTPGLRPDKVTIGHVMTAKPIVVRPQSVAVDALRLMREGGFRHLPVKQDGRVVGVISLRDFFGMEYAEVDRQLDFETAIAEGH